MASFRLHLNKYILLFFIAFIPVYSNASEPSLSASTQLATAGNFQLEWQPSEAATLFELQESLNEDFSASRTIYRGADQASVISGRSNGQYVYRVRQFSADNQQPSAWSPAVTVTVEHHSLSRALSFFLIGLVVFIATLITIIRGAKQRPN